MKRNQTIMGDGEGKQMSLYGKYYLSPEEMAGLWKNVLCVSKVHSELESLLTLLDILG